MNSEHIALFVIIIIAVSAGLLAYSFINMVFYTLSTRTDIGYHSWTKVVYDGKYIQEWYIECYDDRILNITPESNLIYVGENYTKKDLLQYKWC